MPQQHSTPLSINFFRADRRPRQAPPPAHEGRPGAAPPGPARGEQGRRGGGGAAAAAVAAVARHGGPSSGQGTIGFAGTAGLLKSRPGHALSCGYCMCVRHCSGPCHLDPWRRGQTQCPTAHRPAMEPASVRRVLGSWSMDGVTDMRCLHGGRTALPHRCSLRGRAAMPCSGVAAGRLALLRV